MSRTSQESTARREQRGSRARIALVWLLVGVLVVSAAAVWFLTPRTAALTDGAYTCHPATEAVAVAPVVATVEAGTLTQVRPAAGVEDAAPIRDWSEVTRSTRYRFDVTLDDGADPSGTRYECIWSGRS